MLNSSELTVPALAQPRIPVLAAPLIDPGQARVELSVPVGLYLDQIVALALPQLLPADYDKCRVVLVTKDGCMPVRQEHWHRIRPRAGVQIVIRLIPGKDVLRSVLMVMVAVAAVALGQYWALPVAGALGISTAAASALIGLGVSVIGNLLINALIPPVSAADASKPRPIFAITGWRNAMTPDGPVPVVLGKHRFAPPFAAQSYTEIVGDLQYVRAVFCFGYGQVKISDLKIGDTPITSYKNVQTEIREGLSGDLPLTLYPKQVVEEQYGAALLRELPRDAYGEPIRGGVPVDQPVARFTASDASEAAVIIGFPSGLVHMNNEGKATYRAVNIRIRQRLAGTTTWQLVTNLKPRAKKPEGLYRQYRWKLPARGRWEIELCRMTWENLDNQIVDRSVWVSLQSFRPEYPLNFGKPLALLAIRVKATYQLNSALDSLNAMVQRVCPDWDKATQSWITRETRNPASLFRFVLQNAANAYPMPNAEIDLAGLADWHDYCAAKGLKYDRVHDFEASLADTLTAVAAAGRASPRWDGRRMGVVIDRPRDLVIDHINPRNSHGFNWQRTYIDPPHAFRVPFLDETNDYQAGERVVPWPGHVGEITLEEQFELPGKTDPAEIWREARRRMYETMHRPDRFTATQDGAVRVATRGDLVMGSWDVLTSTQKAARVVWLRGNLVGLDEELAMEDGESYAIRFRLFANPADTIGTSLVRPVVTAFGISTAVRLTGDGPLPLPGDIVHFGTALNESLALIVKDVEAADDMSSIIAMVEASPIIDELTDADVPPAWSGRVGGNLGDGNQVPAVPVIVAIVTGLQGTDNINGLALQLQPGVGSMAVLTGYDIRHRLSGTTDWTTMTTTVADGGGAVDGYTNGQMVDISARAVSISGLVSDWTITLTPTIGFLDLVFPQSLPTDAAVVTGSLGHASISFTTGDDENLAKVQIYRTLAGTALNIATHTVGLPVSVVPLTSYTRIDGDASRVNLIANGSFATDVGWDFGAGWTRDGGKVAKASGSTYALSQPVSLTAGKTYRLNITVSGRNDGTITPQLTGGTVVAASAINEDGIYSVDLVAISGNDTLTFLPSALFDGAIDNVMLFEVTLSTLASGDYDYYLEPQTAGNVPGPMSGPHTVTVV
jgi:hypothetical protein